MTTILVIIAAALVGVFGQHFSAASIFGAGGALVIALTALSLKNSRLDATWLAVLWVLVWALVTLVVKLKIFISSGLEWLFLPSLVMIFPIYVSLLSLPAITIIWWRSKQDKSTQR